MTDLDALLAQADKHHVRPGDDECWECGSDTWPCDYVLLAAAVRGLREFVRAYDAWSENWDDDHADAIDAARAVLDEATRETP